MKNARINQQRIWYATYESDKPLLDDEGFETAENVTGYSIPVEIRANISPAKGSSQEELFGKNLDYTKIMVTCDTSLPINEFSRIWENKPVLLPDGTADGDSADYSVVQVARALYSVAYALQKLPKSAG
jgi:hypothetical protein